MTRLRTGGELLRFAGWMALPLAMGALSGFATADSVSGWYRTLEQPSFAPPNWVFGPVWTLLYVMMGLAAYLASRAARLTLGKASEWVAARRLFFGQLALNGLWSLLFFGLQRPDLALVEIVALWAAILLTLRAFLSLSKPATLLLLPYWAWVTFATALNAAYWWLNR